MDKTIILTGVWLERVLGTLRILSSYVHMYWHTKIFEIVHISNRVALNQKEAIFSHFLSANISRLGVEDIPGIGKPLDFK